VSVNVPADGTLVASGIMPEYDAVTAFTGKVSVPEELLKAAGWVGVNTAVSDSGPADANVVVVVATPVTFTATGEPMSVPPTSNCTDPLGWVPLAAITAAVSFTGAPAVAGFGDAVKPVVVDTAAVPPPGGEPDPRPGR
jgi:hypothetical protein